MPAIITEYAFLDSKDYSAIDSVAEMELEALAIAIALCKHLGVAPKFLKEDITDDKLKSNLQILSNNGIIVSPNYWLKHAKKGEVCDGEYVAILIEKIANTLK